MKSACFCLWLFAAGAQAQVIPDEFIRRVTSDLSALKGLPGPLPGDRLGGLADLTRPELRALRAFIADKAPSQNRVMAHLAADFADRYRKPVVPWELNYAFTTALAGRDLSDEMLSRLAGALVVALDAAVDYRRSEVPFPALPKVRASLELVHHELIAAGVSSADTNVILEYLFKIGSPISNGPLIKPIPLRRQDTTS